MPSHDTAYTDIGPLATPAPDLSVSDPENAPPPLDLRALPPALRAACANAGWTQLMPVQSYALPYLLAGRDLMVQSRTGSGKTGAYLLPLLDRINAEQRAVQALVLVPTRELALQVTQEAATLAAGASLSVVAVYGGTGYGKQLEALRRGVQLVVGTPGRVLDHLLRRALTLDALNALVLDEADRMLSIGFYPDMKEVQRYLPKRRVLVGFFSATYPPHVLKLADEFLFEPSMLSLSHKQAYVAESEHILCECRPMDKDRALVRILETENPASAIIFCNTKANVHYVTAVLQGFGCDADALCADLPQSRREAVLANVREGRLRYLVATDVAARGIDIPELSHVILYEPPEDRESYIHRAGRTGRAGAAGTVISLVDVMQKLELQRIARFYKIPLIERPTPDDDAVAHVVGARLTALLESRLRRRTGLEKERLARFAPLAHSLAEDEEQRQLLALLLDAFYQDSLHAPPPGPRGIPEQAESNPARTRRPKRGRRAKNTGSTA